jgi:hypothetical protein
MNEPISPQPKHAKHWRARLLDAWQLIFVLFSAFVFLILLAGDHRKLEAPGAPVALFWVTVVAAGLVLIVHWPSVFGRLPSRWRGGPYIAWVGFFFLMVTTSTSVDSAWERTPQGAAEAKQAEAADAEAARVRQIEAEAEERRQRDGAALMEAEQLQEQVQELADKLEGCFTTFGHRLPALETSVKDSLHNPDAFEHVETLAIVPEADGSNVAMKFRAENGFGAIRLGVVKASVDPNNCEIGTIGNPEPI